MKPSPGAKRFRALRTPDHSSPGSDSWVVFDTTKSDRSGNFEYLADCSSAKNARLVADALNAFVPSKRFVPRDKIAATHSPRIDAKRFRADVDGLQKKTDQELKPLRGKTGAKKLRRAIRTPGKLHGRAKAGRF